MRCCPLIGSRFILGTMKILFADSIAWALYACYTDFVELSDHNLCARFNITDIQGINGEDS